MMDHTQFEMQVAATLAAAIAPARGIKETVAIVDLMVEIRNELASRSVITKTSAAFIPKGR